MAEISTLVYLVDDLNLPSDMILTPNFESYLQEDFNPLFLDLLEIDPGEDLVVRTLERLEEK
jgi:hypothetical protein